MNTKPILAMIRSKVRLLQEHSVTVAKIACNAAQKHSACLPVAIWKRNNTSTTYMSTGYMRSTI